MVEDRVLVVMKGLLMGVGEERMSLDNLDNEYDYDDGIMNAKER